MHAAVDHCKVAPARMITREPPLAARDLSPDSLAGNGDRPFGLQRGVKQVELNPRVAIVRTKLPTGNLVYE